MKMYLDLIDCPLAKWWPKSTPTKIPIMTGIHEKDFDIIDSEMPDGWREEYNSIAGAAPHQKLIPIGFDESKLPKGAKIVVEDEAS
jgi:hypothetical protein